MDDLFIAVCSAGTLCLSANIMKDTPTGPPSIPSTGTQWMWDLTGTLWVGLLNWKFQVVHCFEQDEVPVAFKYILGAQ